MRERVNVRWTEILKWSEWIVLWPSIAVQYTLSLKKIWGIYKVCVCVYILLFLLYTYQSKDDMPSNLFLQISADVLIDLVHPGSKRLVSSNLSKYTLISFNVFSLIDLTQARVSVQFTASFPPERAQLETLSKTNSAFYC